MSDSLWFPSNGFRDLPLKPELLRAITDNGFEVPSEVQQECLPHSLAGRDIVCQAKSGMEKTTIYVLSSLNHLNIIDGQCSILVLCYTRELAYQISKEFDRFSKYTTTANVAVFVGGVSITNDEKVLMTNPPHIVIGTPGRILTLIRNRKLSTRFLRNIILDECDKLLEQVDVRRDVEEIFQSSYSDYQKQIMVFATSLPKDTRYVYKRYMTNPVEVYVDVVAKLKIVDDQAKVTLRGRQIYQVKVKENQQRRVSDLLDVLEFNQVVIFVKSVHRMSTMSQTLIENNFPPISVHREITQEEKLSPGFQQFKDLNKKVLAATHLFGKSPEADRANMLFVHESNEDPDTFLNRFVPFGSKTFAVGFVSEQFDTHTTIPSSEIRQRHISSSPTPKKVVAETTITPEGTPILSPQGRNQLRNRLAKSPIKLEGNPDTQITRTFEFHFLVLLMLSLSNMINSKLGKFFEKHYHTRSVISHVLEIILSPPTTYTKVSKDHDLKPQTQTVVHLPSRVWLRFLAHKGIVTIAVVLISLLHLIGWSLVNTVLLGTLTGSVYVLVKATINWTIEKLK